MSKNNILHTPFARAYNLEALAKDAAKFIINPAHVDADQATYQKLINDIRPMTITPMFNLLLSFVKSDMLKHLYICSYIKNKKLDIPELLTIGDIIVDAKYIDVTLPNQFQKPWVNVSSALSVSTGQSGQRSDRIGVLYVDDTSKLTSLVTKALLCVSYNDSTEWLPPTISTFLIEFYTMSLSMVVERLYNLNWEEAILPKMMFAWYYASLLGPEKDNSDFPILLNRSSKLFKEGISASVFNMPLVVDKVNTIRNKRTMSLDIVCEVLRELGASRMKTLDASTLRRLFALSTQDNTSMMIAVDYPPYFLHQILRVAEGYKHAILTTIYKNRFKPSILTTVFNELATNKKMITGVNR